MGSSTGHLRTKAAENEVKQTGNNTPKTLSPEEENGHRNRQKQAAQIAADVAVAARALFVSVFMKKFSSSRRLYTNVFPKSTIKF